jgi:DNA-binding IscR family transcriptional regulator
MSNPADAPPYEDVNDSVMQDWVDETTPYERVRQVIGHTYSSIKADTVADRAQTAAKTARKHLDTLADEGFVTTSSGEHGATTYRRSPESLVVEQAADILKHVSTDELVSRITDMRERLESYRAEYGVDAPEELAVDQTNQTLTNTEEDRLEIDSATLQEWQTTRRNLAFANAALSIANAERFVDGDRQPTDDSLTA